MIGDYFNRMAAAENESPKQQQQSVQNGILTPNMAQDAAQSQPKAMPQGQPQTSGSIAGDIMQAADQVTAPERMMKQIEQLKSEIPQLQAAIQSGDIQAYEGIPLLKDKVANLRQLEAQLNPQAGVTQLASNLPQTPQGYAAGGVIAFAGNTDGSYVDTDEEDDDVGYGGLSKQEQALMAQFLQQMEAQPEEGEEGIAAVAPQAGKEEFGINPYKKSSTEGIQYTSKKHKYENRIREEARKAGIPEELFLHMMAKETGGLENPESAVSKAGARGIAQFMPATAKQYGIDPMDVNQALPAAAKMTGSLLKHYNGDQRLAAMAYNWGQGNVDKWLANGADPSKVPGETAGYIRANEGGIMALASGGAIAFDDGGGIKNPYERPIDPNDSAFMQDINRFRNWATAPSPTMQAIRDYFTKPAKSEDTPTTPTSVITGSRMPGDQFQTPQAKPQGLPETDKDIEDYVQQKAASEEEIGSLRDMLKERAASAKGQKEIDAYMALLQAGLGMMGGSSPYAMQNIGKGASTGLQYAMDARKQQIADENALLSGRLGLAKAELFEKSRLNALKRQIDLDKQKAEQFKQTLGLRTREATVRQGQLRQKAITGWEGSTEKAAIEGELAKQKKDWRSDPKLLGQYKTAQERYISNIMEGGEEPNAPSAASLLNQP